MRPNTVIQGTRLNHAFRMEEGDSWITPGRAQKILKVVYKDPSLDGVVRELTTTEVLPSTHKMPSGSLAGNETWVLLPGAIHAVKVRIRLDLRPGDSWIHQTKAEYYVKEINFGPFGRLLTLWSLTRSRNK